MKRPPARYRHGEARVQRAHPYMSNSVPALKQEMLAPRSASARSRSCSSRSRRTTALGPLDLPPALASEAALRRHSSTCCAKNETCERNLSFLGGGMLAAPRAGDRRRDRRAERVPDPGLGHAAIGLTGATRPGSSSRASSASCSSMDFVGLPVYSWGCAAGHAIRMAARLTGRQRGARARDRSTPSGSR